MMASLYDDIDEVSKSDKMGPASGWGTSSLKMMQSHLQNRKQRGGRRPNAPTGPTLAPVIDLKRSTPASGSEGDYRFNQQTGKLERVHAAPAPSPFIGDPTVSLGVTDEYNPLHPNDYEELAKAKREKRRQEEKEDEQKSSRSGLCKRPRDEDSDSEEEREREERHRSRGAIQGAAIAPPPSLVEEPQPPPNMQMPEDQEKPQLASAAGKFGINSVAAKMMMRMGYREGQGLGRESQGMSTALLVQKTSRRGGKIIHEKDLPGTGREAAPQPVVPQHLLDCATRVILLRNMVGPGEVDDELEGETAEECTKYGPVVTCMIFELPDAPHDEAVRIFVEFQAPESAARAYMDLNGRYFGGRVVKAGFYDVDNFSNLELSYPPLPMG